VKLFEVTSWGNDVDGGNGPDTNYLVCARDHEEAAALVRDRQPDLDAITELGMCSAEVECPVVLRGPYIQHKLDPGAHFTLWSWDPRGLDVFGWERHGSAFRFDSSGSHRRQSRGALVGRRYSGPN